MLINEELSACIRVHLRSQGLRDKIETMNHEVRGGLGYTNAQIDQLIEQRTVFI